MNQRLQICQEVEAAGEAGLKGITANPRFRSISQRAKAVILQDAVDEGLIEGFRILQAHHYFRLTEAGRFYLQTAITGPKAHSILDEIEAEMAGDA